MITYFRAISLDGSLVISPNFKMKEEVLNYMIEEHSEGVKFTVQQVYELE